MVAKTIPQARYPPGYCRVWFDPSPPGYGPPFQSPACSHRPVAKKRGLPESRPQPFFIVV